MVFWSVQKKLKAKYLIFVCIAACVVLGLGWIYRHSEIGRFSIYDEEATYQSIPANNHHDEKTPPPVIDAMSNKFIKSLTTKLEIHDPRKFDQHSTTYDYILENHHMGSVLNDLSFRERCDLYFRYVYLQDNNWVFEPKKEVPNDQYVVDMLSHLRIFNKCYLTNDDTLQINSIDKLVKSEKSVFRNAPGSVGRFEYTEDEKLINSKSFENCNDLEHRMYKWLSLSYPIYERWTGDTHLSPPVMKDFVEYPEVFKTSNPIFKGTTGKPIDSDFTNGKRCFLNQFKSLMNGRGIVLSIGNAHVDDAVRLIHLLRALNNHYPIQIVYYDELESEVKRKIVNAARNRMTDLPQSFEKVRHRFPDGYLDISHGGLPQQEVWFVNVKNAIHAHYKDKFRTWYNKFLAAFFNSFEEFMILDADSVLLQSPDYFFNLRNYIKTGALFYKDRSATSFRPDSDTDFIQKLTPSIVDNLFFDIPIISKHTMNIELFQGLKHYMESGLVVLNRNLHFSSILNIVNINFFEQIKAMSWGDKELFWYAFVMNGDESFHFNKNFAASIGKITPDDERENNNGKPKKSKEICAAHPGHISDEDNALVWLNSGFQFCSKDVDYEKEVERQNRFKTFKTAGQLKEFYTDPLRITHAIIPPFKDKTSMVHSNSDDEPGKGWVLERNYCGSYLWCAYSSIGGATKDGEDNTLTGTIFKFDKESIELFNYYGDVWVGIE